MPSLLCRIGLAVVAAACTLTTAMGQSPIVTLAPNNSSGGVFLTITPTSTPLNITGFQTYFAGTAGTAANVEVWTRPGNYVGFTASNAGWTLAQTVSGTAAGTATLSNLFTLSTPILIPVGGPTSIYFHGVSTGNGLRYQGTGTTATQTFTNTDLTLFSSIARTGLVAFAGTQNTPRAFSGAIHYQLANVSGACCRTSGACDVGQVSGCTTPDLFQGTSTTCAAGNLCPNSTTACCNNITPTCTFISSGSCPAGTTANGTTCSPNACPTTGACCSAAGTCSVTATAGCVSPSLFQSLGTTCSGVGGTCPVIVNACCNGLSAACSFVVGPCVTGSTATGSVCAPSPCVGLPAIVQNFNASSSLPTCWDTGVIIGSAPGTNPTPNPWTIASDQSNSTPNAAFAPDQAGTFSEFLVLPTVTALGNVTIDLWARWATEGVSPNFFDGWTIEASINGGAFTNIGAAAFSQNGYTGAISTAWQSPIMGQQAFSAISGGGATPVWVNPRAGITAVAGDQIAIRFHMASDQTVASTGVWIDDVTIANVAANGACCDLAGACSFVSAANCIGGSTWSAACTCSPSPCPPPSSGVCCRGATCSTAYANAGACAAAVDTTSPATIVSKFVSSSSTCNTPVTTPGSLGNTISPCCYANFNHNASLEVQDIFDFLNDWFAGKKAAIVGGDGISGTLAVQNIFDFLNAWFAGGCS